MKQSLSKSSPDAKPPGNNLKIFPRFSRSEFVQLALILGLGLILRLLYLLQFKGSIFYNHYVLDSLVLDNWAKDIVSGNFWGSTAFFRAPLYAYLIALIYKLFGTSHLCIILFQNLIGLSTIYLTYIYGRYLFGQRVALVAGLMAAWYPTLIYYEGELMITSLEVFATLLSLVFIQRAMNRKSPRSFLVAGLILGLAAITRPTALVVALVVPLFIWVFKRPNFGSRVSITMAFLIGLALPILPVTVRNLVVSHDLVLISTQAGANFYIGNSAKSDGISVIALGAEVKAEEYQDNIYTSSVRTAERAVGHKLKDSEVSAYWTRQALSDITSNPARTLGLFFKKIYLFWHGEEIMNDRSVYYGGEYSSMLKISIWKWLVNFPSGLLFPLMGLGIYFAIKNRTNVDLPLWLLLLYTLGISLFFVCSRFRQPIVPLACLFGAYGAFEMIRSFRTGGARRSVVAIGFFVAMLVLLNLGGEVDSKTNRSQFELIMGYVFYQDGNNTEAAAHYEQALVIEPGNIAVYGLLSNAYSKLQRIDDAANILKKGLEMYPDYSVFNYNLGLIYAQKFEIELAKSCFRKTIALDPNFALPYLRLGEIYSYEHKPDSSKMMYQLLLQVDPTNAEARAKLQP